MKSNTLPFDIGITVNPGRLHTITYHHINLFLVLLGYLTVLYYPLFCNLLAVRPCVLNVFSAHFSVLLGRVGKAYCARADSNIRVSLMKSTLAACHEPEGNYNRLPEVRYVFEHNAQYLLAHAPCTCTVVFWHIRDMLLKIFRRVQFVIITPTPPPPYTPCFV